jgi:hypothetical protein
VPSSLARRIGSASCVVLLALIDGATAVAQTAAQTASAQAVRTDTRITVDGALDEPAWNGAPVITGFLQRDPDEGQAATEQTEVRILYTSAGVFFGITCHDADASRITATELRRDNTFENDDLVSIILDTLHDHRSAYVFRTNPAGTQYDALITDEGKVVDPNWDESWTSAALVTPTGWTAEIEIPFKILRLTDREEQVWGIDFERVIRRKTEFTYWSNYRRGFTFNQVSRAGQLTGLRGIRTGLTARIKPFVRTAVKNTSAPAPGAQPTVSQSAIGLEDVKYRVTSDFTVDFTANTDFAEADVDAQVLNLTRFPVFFPERREFFVEGAGIYDYGPGGGAAAEIKLFFSRSIGLSPERETIPIIAGSKLTGKANGWSVGVLDVQTDSHRNTPQRNFSVVRVKKDLFSRSNVGFIANNRSSFTARDPYNRGFGVDGNFVLLEHWNIQTFALSTYSPGKSRDHWAGRLRTNWDTDRWWLDFEQLLIQRDVNPEMGWLPRRDMQKTKLQMDYKPRPGGDLVRQFFFRGNLDYITNQAGALETRNQDLTFETLFQSGDRVFARYSQLFDLIRRPFQIQGRVPVAPGAYNWNSAQWRFTPSPSRSLSGDISVRRQWGFYGGDNLEITWTPLWKTNTKLSLTPAYQFTYLTLPGGRFTSHLVNSQINYAFSNRWLTSTTVPYNNLTRVVVGNVRLDYIYRSGDDLFVIYNDSNTLVTSMIPGLRDRSLIVKLTRSIDW